MNEIRFSKEELLEELKNDILDRLSDDFYGWIFTEPGEIQDLLADKIANVILQIFNEGKQKELMDKVVENLINHFIKECSYKIYDEVADKLVQGLLKDVKLDINVIRDNELLEAKNE